MRKNEAIWIPKRKRWQINVQEDGERKTFTDPTPYQEGKKNQPGKIACEKKADKWIKDHLVSENTRVEILLDRWYDELQLSTSYSHYHQYEKYIRLWIKPEIGTKRICMISQNDLQHVINSSYAAGKLIIKKQSKYEPKPDEIVYIHSNEKLSAKTLTNISKCLMAFMKYCRTIRATTFIPEKLTIPSSAKRSAKTVASTNDIVTLFTVSTTIFRKKRIEDRFIHAYRLYVLTGMRPGELIALKNENIKGKKITITNSINDEDELTEGKNENAQRTYNLDNHALKVLQDQKDMLKRLLQISPYVFPSKDGDFVRQRTLRDKWRRYCESNNINGANTPYELRHTFVSVNKNMPEGLKKMVIGHSEDMDTEGQYGHEMAGDMEEAEAYVSSAFKKILGW